MKALNVLAVLVLTALSSASASGQWYKISNEGVLRVKFADSLNGVAASAGFVAVTNDGGLSWQKPEVPKVWYLGLSVLNSRIMHASGTGTSTGFTPAVIIRSIDGGKTWESQTVRQAEVINDVSFIDPLEGWGVGMADALAETDDPYPGIIIHTIDGGQSWETQLAEGLRHLLNVVFLNKKLGLACADSSQLARTVDGGVTWQVSTVPEPSVQLGPISFIDERNGWILGQDFLGLGHGVPTTYLYRTFDSGVSWELVYQNEEASFYSIQMINDLYGLASGQGNSSDGMALLGTIWETQDGGYTWTVVYQNTVQRGFYGISFLTRNLGWVGGFDGIVKYTTEPPIITAVEQSEVSGVPARFHLAQNYPNPFNPETTIHYSLPTAGQVRLVVYDALGQLVRILVDGRQEVGDHAVVFTAGDLPSGTYIYHLTAGEAVETRKMLLLK